MIPLIFRGFPLIFLGFPSIFHDFFDIPWFSLDFPWFSFDFPWFSLDLLLIFHGFQWLFHNTLGGGSRPQYCDLYQIITKTWTIPLMHPRHDHGQGHGRDHMVKNKKLIKIDKASNTSTRRLRAEKSEQHQISVVKFGSRSQILVRSSKEKMRERAHLKGWGSLSLL